MSLTPSHHHLVSPVGQGLVLYPHSYRPPDLAAVLKKLGTRIAVGRGPAAFVQNTYKHLSSITFLLQTLFSDTSCLGHVGQGWWRGLCS